LLLLAASAAADRAKGVIDKVAGALDPKAALGRYRLTWK
jgi:hypothetical protein